MHVWTHRRFHEAKEGKYLRYWLAVRTKIQTLERRFLNGEGKKLESGAGPEI